MHVDPREQLALVAGLAKWSLLGSLVGVISGAASAAFLLGLEWATHTRIENPWTLWLLPLAGAGIGWVYSRFGREVEAGNNLLLERIHTMDGHVSVVMAPLIALSTIGTHLFGGSAGREGTAVQMGGSLADYLARKLRLNRVDRRILLMSGISGGFGSVFGTPIAGMIFGLEVLAIGRLRYDALVPCFVASTIGNLTCHAFGIVHHPYAVGPAPEITPSLLVWTALAGLAFGLAALVFAELTHLIQHTMKAKVNVPWLRPFFGGLIVIGMTLAVGTRDYLGLSLPLIADSFEPGKVIPWAFALKILFTAITLGSGFKGGEVTPLFCIGATLGHTFATNFGLPVPTFAALGFVAVFAGAANTPLTCLMMGIELFGAELAVPLSLACIVSYIASGHRGIYMSQRIGTPKSHAIHVEPDATLHETRALGLKFKLRHLENEPAPGDQGQADG